nr:SapC family protein [Salinimonas marina]
MRAGPAENVFFHNNQWLAQYTPLSLQTLPFILQRQGSASEADMLIDCHCPALSKSQGEALYLSSGRATVYLNNKKKLLTERVTAMTQTTDLLHEMANLGLFRPVDLVLLFTDGSRQRIGGLYGVDEHALHALSADDLKMLNTNNTLAALFNILGSVFQVNRLIRLHNQKFPNRAVSNIKLETNKQ